MRRPCSSRRVAVAHDDHVQVGRRVAAVDEHLDVILLLWRGGPLSHRHAGDADEDRALFDRDLPSLQPTVLVRPLDPATLRPVEAPARTPVRPFQPAARGRRSPADSRARPGRPGRATGAGSTAASTASPRRHSDTGAPFRRAPSGRAAGNGTRGCAASGSERAKRKKRQRSERFIRTTPRQSDEQHRGSGPRIQRTAAPLAPSAGPPYHPPRVSNRPSGGTP